MKYTIPLFDLNFDEKEEQAVLDVFRSKWISSGPKCEEFEHLFASMLGSRHAISLANCTTALHLACSILGLGQGDEVICPSLTFVATVNAIKYVGATPVFCDICGPQDLTIDPLSIEKHITPKTKAIIVMHYAGYPCDMDTILSLAKKHQLKIIEDACHGPLSEYHGQKLGTLGDVGCFSFFSNKNISTGEGGMILTNDDNLARKIKLLRSHGMTTMSYQRAEGYATVYDVVELGFNYRMDDIRASIGITQLNKLKGDIGKRKEIRKFYNELLMDIEEITVPFLNNKEFVSNYIFPVVLNNSNEENRDKVRDLMHRAGIQTSVHYPAVHRFSIYSDPACSLSFTEYVSDNEITLPMYGALDKESVIYICETLKKAVSRHRG
ncbi:MAG: DegT/DnrJ/EryC1/StrS family aminotransferase [bacterium]